MEKKDFLYENLLCTACLCVDKKIENIFEYNLKEYYYNILKELPFFCIYNVEELRLCWECRALLKKVFAFREQVKDCHRILQTYTNENLSECLFSDVSRAPRLAIQPQTAITVYPQDHIKTPDNEKFKKSATNDNTYNCEEVKAEEDIKEESDHSDTDNNYLSDNFEEITNLEKEVQVLLDADSRTENDGSDKIKKDKRINKKFKKDKRINKKFKKDKKLLKTKKDYKNKIKTIELSYKAMMEERSEEAKKPPYVKSDYKCDTCILGFNYVSVYKNHLAKKHSPELGNYSCPVCKTVLPNTNAFTTHYKRHIRRYVCLSCGKRASNRKFLLQHYQASHEGRVKQYTCDVCGKLSTTIDAHRYHQGTHNKRVECQDCDKTFSHRAGLKNHRLTVHNGNNRFPCTVCSKVFIWKTSLKKHMEKHDKKVKPLNEQPFCEPCGVTFASICSLQRHMKNSLKHVTEDELRYICNDCGRKFSNKTKLRDHIEEKHLYKAYQCHICHKASKNRVCLDQHIRNVHKGRPKNKICHHCGKGFPTKVQLESHIRTHTGEKPFICEHCPTTFSQQSNLYKHTRQIHMNIKARRYPLARKRKDKPPTAPLVSVFPLQMYQNKEPPPLIYVSEKEFII